LSTTARGNFDLVRRHRTLVVWWALLFLLWIAFVGTTSGQELVAGALAAAVATVTVAVVRAQGLLRFRVDRAWLLRGAKAPVAIVYDFGLVTWILVRQLARRRRVEGRLVESDFPAGDAHARYAFRRAFAITVGTMSANAIVVDVDVERNVAVLHSLDADRWTGSTAL